MPKDYTYAERIISLEEKHMALDRLLEAHRSSHTREHEQLQEAVDEFKRYLASKLAEMNEVRDQINQERGRYATHDALNGRYGILETRIETAEHATDIRLKNIESTISNFQGRLWMLGVSLSALYLLLKIFWK